MQFEQCQPGSSDPVAIAQLEYCQTLAVRTVSKILLTQKVKCAVQEKLAEEISLMLGQESWSELPT
jgi:hypothetical protein